MEDFQKITENENQLKKTSKENHDAAHDDSELDLDDTNLDLDDYDDKYDAATNHGAHDDDVDEDGDDADDDMEQDHDIDDDDNHNAADDDGTSEAIEDDVNDVDQDDVAVVEEAHVNEDDVDDNEDYDDDSHEANDDDDVDNDPSVQNNEETATNKLNQLEQACADQANEKTPAKSAEIPKEQKNNLRKQLASDIPVEAFEATKNAEIFGRKITISCTLSTSHPKKRKKRAWKYKRRKFKRTSKTMKLLTQHEDEKAALCIEAQRNLLSLHQAHIRQYKKRRKPACKYKLGHQMPIQPELKLPLGLNLRLELQLGLKLRPKFFGPYESVHPSDCYEVRKIRYEGTIMISTYQPPGEDAWQGRMAVWTFDFTTYRPFAFLHLATASAAR
ncbi:nonsense-mediated mRNA decay protein 2-like [Stegodyphus dumicola]|uniref:nonsense-mediated mRNA decay protein 2-like n=1 Tax=Stegodyphus dumicola TaxID=202533 RepID=UPI0015B35C86|nr:nonsense-mediated mRNA decay protein 2-like [Stegodyphus dumicola]